MAVNALASIDMNRGAIALNIKIDQIGPRDSRIYVINVGRQYDLVALELNGPPPRLERRRRAVGAAPESAVYPIVHGMKVYRKSGVLHGCMGYILETDLKRMPGPELHRRIAILVEHPQGRYFDDLPPAE